MRDLTALNQQLRNDRLCQLGRKERPSIEPPPLGRCALRISFSAVAVLIAVGAAPTPAAAQTTNSASASQISERVGAIEGTLRSRQGTVLGLMGYNVVPDGSANALQISRSNIGGGDGEADTTLTLSQFGFGFTWSESFPLFTEIYAGYARYDPRALLGGEETRRTPLRWNNFTSTIGVGYDIPIANNLWLRPIVNASIGYAASDAGLFGGLINLRRDVDISALTDQHLNAWGFGGSLVLAYYDYRPERDIETELRYTSIRLETFGDTLPAGRGSADATALGLWARYRWPTGREVFGRPLRWVVDGTATTYLGDQRDATGFAWSAKIGGGIEFDTGRWELGLAGINLTRVRFIGRYFFADDNVSGYSFGIGMSF
jgi:hypothetical protein